jgi:glycosyltransferase involved in cell wall biosynthesis
MVSKACIVGSYQRKLEEIARFSDVELMVVVPPAWSDGSRTIRLERAYVNGYQLVVEPILLNGSFHLHFYPRLGQRLRVYGPDVVHVDEEPYNLATFHAMRMAKRAGARALWFTWQNLHRRYPFPVRLIERYNLRQADYAIAGSDGAAAVWREKGYAGRLAVIPQFGVDPDIFFPQAISHAVPGEITIGYIGRLVREKGVDLLLTALSGVRAKWRLIVAGAGSERERLERLADHLGIAHQISFVGVMPSLRTPAFYQELDTLVLPSRSQSNWVEQFGRVLIEAMACGVAVVGSDCGEIPNVIGDAGIVFPENDANALEDCLQRLAVDLNLRIDLGARGRERVLAHFTQARIAEQTVAVYREMTERAS